MTTTLSDVNRTELAKGLSVLLADTYTLYLKTHKYHWNVEGSTFASLHLLFEQFYTETWQAGDEIAERIRALGHYAPGSYHEFGALSTIKEIQGHLKAKAMIEDLLAGQESVIQTARSVVPIAEKAGDQATLDLVTRRLDIHEKNAWMLRSLLSE
jgi:starvation-inducible DNA-binding protein